MNTALRLDSRAMEKAGPGDRSTHRDAVRVEVYPLVLQGDTKAGNPKLRDLRDYKGSAQQCTDNSRWIL